MGSPKVEAPLSNVPDASGGFATSDMPDTSDTSNTPAAPQSLEHELLKAAYRRQPAALWITAGMIVCMLAELVGIGVNPWRAALWCALTSLVTALDALGYFMYRRHYRPDASPRRWQRAFLLQCTWSGLAWGVGPLLLLQPISSASMLHLAGLAIPLVGLGTGSAALLSAQRLGSWVMTATCQLPLVLLLLSSQQDSHKVIGVALAAALVLQLWQANDLHKALRSQIQSDAALRSAVEAARKARLEAERASAMKTQFLANVSHELRTPMNAIVGMQKLLEATPLNAQQKNYVEHTQSASETLLHLINDVLDFSKIEAGQLVLEDRPFAIKHFATQVQQVLQAALSDKPLQLVVELGAHIPEFLIGDMHRLRQVLLNLGGNAIKFTERGQVTLRIEVATRQGEKVLLRFVVMDTGIGMDEAQQQRVFEEFIQADASIARKYGGTGLGLSISQRLVHAMGGTLRVSSALAKGSTFSFEVPLHVLAEHAPAATTVPSHVKAGARLQGMRILLVEDDALNQQIARELLQNEGASVSVANNGREAVASVLDNPGYFDLVLMDLQMPIMSGYQATALLRAEFSADELPILAMSANAMRQDTATSLAAGMNEHIGKPFDLDDLTQRLQRYRR